jgi:hypothetical protein
VSFEPDILRCKRTHIDQSEHVCFAGLNLDSQVLCVVDESSLRHRFGTRRIRNADEALEKILHEIVVPVREGEHDFLVVEILVRILWVMHNEGATQAIGVLSTFMAMVPVCAGLVDLRVLACPM